MKRKVKKRLYLQQVHLSTAKKYQQLAPMNAKENEIDVFFYLFYIFVFIYYFSFLFYVEAVD